MEIIKLNSWQMFKVYYSKMKKDFSRNELKPFIVISRGMKKGEYECVGLLDNNRILGYGVMVKHGKDYLFDYLATEKEERNKGLGAKFLEMMKEYLKDADSVIGEVEDPLYGKDEADKKLRQRRVGFYLRNGIVDTDLRVKLFGEYFYVMEMVVNRPHSYDEVESLYKMHYQKILSEKMFKENVEILK